MSDTPRDDLYRMTTLDAGRLAIRDDNGDGPLLVGYPIVYNKWTEITGWEGNFLEKIASGAPDRHLKTHSEKVKVLFNHGFDPLIGSKPLGKPRLIESKKRGLYTETPLDATSYNEDLAISIDSGAIDGMSFRFTISRDEWEDEPHKSKANPKGIPQRTVRELKLYEFGPVTFPAYEATTVGLRGQAAYEAYVSTPQVGTLTLANDGVSISGNTITDDALASGHPSVTSKDVARLSRAVSRSLKEHTNVGRTTPTSR